MHCGAVCELQAPDGAAELNPTQRIQQVWQDEPTEGWLHVCVKIRIPCGESDLLVARVPHVLLVPY
jgi:hypothetical protein